APNEPFWAQFNRLTLEDGTFMHELGHNLGLRHAGSFDLPNYKPNYRSVMCYRYQLTGVDINCDAEGDNIMGYSHGVLPTLGENALNEDNGLGGPCGGTWIDWNKNCVHDQNVSRD